MTPLSTEAIRQMSNAELLRREEQIANWEKEDRRHNALHYYVPNNPNVMKIHRSVAKTIGVFGGNRSSKTDSCMAEICALATGVFPETLRNEPGFLSKFRGPMRVRFVCESIQTTLHPVMLAKLMWSAWNGLDRPNDKEWMECVGCHWTGRRWMLIFGDAQPKPTAGGAVVGTVCPGCKVGVEFLLSERGPRGHFGWIPKDCLIDGNWASSWREKDRELRIKCRNPWNHDEIEGESIIQILSNDQDVSSHASGEFHAILVDEPPSKGIWDENIARAMSVGGRVYLSMTFPTDMSFPIEWVVDEVLDRGTPGPHKDPNIDAVNLFTMDNPNIDQYEIAIRSSQWGQLEREAKLYGRPPRFSNRIHPLFTEQPKTWCFSCGDNVFAENETCMTCRGKNTAAYCHVDEFEPHPNWPTVLLLDPHPRRPHMGLLLQIDPSDDWWVLDELIVPGDPLAFKQAVDAKERAYKIRIVRWLMDPNMGGSPAGTNREVTWQTEFEKCGLPFELSDDGSPGRALVDERLKPDRHTHRPRITFHPRDTSTILQMKRWCWNEDRNPDRRGLRQTPDDKHSDFPTLLKYLANDFPTFQGYRGVGQPIRYGGALQNGYTGGSTRSYV